MARRRTGQVNSDVDYLPMLAVYAVFKLPIGIADSGTESIRNTGQAHRTKDHLPIPLRGLRCQRMMFRMLNASATEEPMKETMAMLMMCLMESFWISW